MCDWGYELELQTGTCKKAAVTQLVDPSELAYYEYNEHHCLRETKGYRRIPGDTCVGGAAWDPILHCSLLYSRRSTGRIVLGVIFCAAVVLACVTFNSSLNEKFGFRNRLAGLKDMFFGHKYKILDGAPPPDSAIDDDQYYLDDDEFGPEARLIDAETGGGQSTDFAPLPKLESNSAVTSIDALAMPPS
jgi:hypothetical protein